jgi:membrane protein DedA with SNARE-associated domain
MARRPDQPSRDPFQLSSPDSALTAASTEPRVNSHLQDLIGIVSAHASWAYAVIFLAALLEALPVAGSFVPGSTVIVALSALVPSGNLKLTPILAAAIAGALVGDGLAYWLGRRAGHEVLTIWPLSKYPAVVSQSETFFHRYGTFAVFFARFVPPVRALVPIIAGALDMSAPRFFAAMIPAVLLWAPAMILPGVLAGSAAERWGAKAEHYALPLVVGIIAVGVFGWTLFCWYKRRQRQSPSANTSAR